MKEVYKRHSDNESTDEFDEDTIYRFMEEQRAMGLTVDECAELSYELNAAHINEKKEFDKWKIFGTFWKLVMGYVDLGTDFATLAMYMTINPLIALVQGIVLAFSFLCQGVISIALGQPYWVGVVGLMGMKPMLEWWRDAFEEPPFVGQLLGNDYILWVSRMTEMSKLLLVVFSSSRVII